MQAALAAGMLAIRIHNEVGLGCATGALDTAGAGRAGKSQDPIAEWLKQDEVDSQIDEVRPDLNALTDQQLQNIFKIGREQVDSPQLIERGGEDHKSVLYIWLIAITVGIAALIAAVKARPFVRGQLRTLLIPVHMKDQS